ncbi:Acetyl-coenzyme A synthetase, chloroplastic/glyoxysomal, partial [Linum perenne]
SKVKVRTVKIHRYKLHCFLVWWNSINKYNVEGTVTAKQGKEKEFIRRKMMMMMTSSPSGAAVSVGLRTHLLHLPSSSSSSSSSSSASSSSLSLTRCKKSKFKSPSSRLYYYSSVKQPSSPLLLLFPPLPRLFFTTHSDPMSSSSNPPFKTTSNHLRHVESMKISPSGAGKIPRLNALILGESLASEEDDLVFPSDQFSREALVSSPDKYLEMYKRSVEDPSGFWGDIASQFFWKTKWGTTVCSENFDVRTGNVFIQVVFAGFSSDSIAQRIMDCKPKAVITCNAVKRGSKVIQLKDIVDAALTDSGKNGFSVGACLTYENQSAMKRESTKWKEGRDVWWQDVVPKYPTTCEVEWVDAEDPLFLLYTSGSTGKPKGVLHTTGGYMVYTATTFKYAFDYKPSDIYWCTADCGWITGHSYVTYGPLLNGASVVIYEGAPNYPDAGRCWDIVDKFKVTIFYTAPTLVRSLMRDGDEYVTRYSRKSLRVLGSVGEPINPSAWRWFFNVIGDSRCPISDTWWQTETGGFMITPLPGAWPQKPGSATFPFFGVQPVIVDEKGVEIEGECSGYLCVKSSWPGAFRTLYGDHERYETTYFKPFPGYYFSGDGCSRDKDGYYWLTGRVDDVINVSGHRIGTAEVESALVSHPQCAEAAVVKGQGIYAFVTLVDGVPYSEALRKDLISAVRKQIGPFAAPDRIHWAPGLPKTRSGKIMRRVLRKIASRQLDELGDTSTLADPGVVDQLIALADS